MLCYKRVVQSAELINATLKFLNNVENKAKPNIRRRFYLDTSIRQLLKPKPEFVS